MFNLPGFASWSMAAAPSASGGAAAELLREAAAEAARGDALLAALERRRLELRGGSPDSGRGRPHVLYKAVARVAASGPGGAQGRLVSVFDGATEYRLGVPTGGAAPCGGGELGAEGAPGGGGGELLAEGGAGGRYFAYATVEEAVACPFPSCSRLAPGREGSAAASLVILQVAGLGPPRHHGRGKLSFPQLLPLAVVPGKVWRGPARWRR
ncbi:unnamed protein product [Prorocentrum cordatum]|uniref:Uncharacterized protein n=1 Tax=Prorocentrum cordatum TaxID=2364126 RepID=A0ABN9SR78_9DINO|nr:unnamed protein product [Polarella glacialis]